MFVVGIFGGLASQMNQYAFMKSLEYHYQDIPVKMAVASDWIKKGQHNGYELDKVFGIERDAVELSVVRKLADFYPGSGFQAYIMKKLFKMKHYLFGEKGSQITLEDPTVFYPEVFQFNRLYNIFFWGNYIHEQYYNCVEDILRNSFVFKPLSDSKNLKYYDSITTVNSVSIHIRHGDYIKYNFSVLTMDYYKKAIRYISERVKNPVFYIFSDDKDFIDKEFEFLEKKVIISNNTGANSYIDMQLMSICKHNIIANSGFSYWAAWLNGNKDKIVVAPDSLVPWCKNPIASKEWVLIKDVVV